MLTPFDLIYAAIIVELKADSDFKENTVIAFDDVVRNKLKAGVQTADLPEVVVYLSNVTGNLTANSSSTKISTNWRYMVSTGQYNSRIIHRLVFNVVRMHKRWHEVFGALEWRGKTFVKDARLVSGQTGLSNSEQNRNISGFAAVLDFEVDLVLNSVDLTQGLS